MDPFVILNFSFFEFNNGLYDTFIIEYPNRTVSIKIESLNNYTFMDNKLIITDLFLEEFMDFFCNPKNKDYNSITMYNSKILRII